MVTKQRVGANNVAAQRGQAHQVWDTYKSMGGNCLKSLAKRLIIYIFKIHYIIITYPLGKTGLAEPLDFRSSS